MSKVSDEMNTPKENIMGTEKISKLVIATGIPLMLSLLIYSSILE